MTTAFPLDQAVKDLGPGVYAMTAEAKDVVSNEYGQQATQWFIVSDLGLTAYSAQDGIDVFVHSLASAEPRGSVDVRLMARNNEVLAVRQTDRNGFIHFEAGLARGEGRCRARRHRRQREGRLCIPQPEISGIRSVRPWRRRAARSRRP